MLNHVVIMGRLTKDPELRRTNSGKAVASFTLAVDRDFKPEDNSPDWIECVAWGNTAEFISKYFTKGRMAVAAGRLQTRSWEAKDGGKRKATEVVVENMYFGDSKKETEAPSYGQSPNGYTQMDGAKPASDFAMLEDDDSQLPF